MCMCHCPSRRAVLLGGAAGLALPLSGCVTGGGGLELVSPAEVEALGLRNWEQIRATTPVSRNQTFTAAAQRTATRLLEAGGEAPGAWEVKVFAGPQVNAFALPGRKIGVYEGLFRVAETDAQLAAVVGHEIGHVAEDHGSDRINAQLTAGLGMDILGAVLAANNVSGAQDISAALGLGVEYGLIRPYSRGQELEADAFGLRLMDRAGYDPRAAITLWQRMQNTGSAPPELISTHPAPATRIAEMERIIDTLA